MGLGGAESARCALLRGSLRAPQVFPLLRSAGEASVHASSRTQAPLSGGDRSPLPPPSTSEDQSDPCLALRESRPSLPPRGPLAIFIHRLYRDAFRGDSGEATPSLVSNRCAPRSGTLPAESSREELQRYEDGALETPVSPARLLCLPLGAGADPRGSQSARAPVLAWLLRPQPVYTQHLLGPTWALLLCRHILPYFVEMQLPTTLQGLISGILC